MLVLSGQTSSDDFQPVRYLTVSGKALKDQSNCIFRLVILQKMYWIKYWVKNTQHNVVRPKPICMTTFFLIHLTVSPQGTTELWPDDTWHHDTKWPVMLLLSTVFINHGFYGK